MSNFGKQLEKKIRGKIVAIKAGTATAKGSGVNDLLKRLKEIDEASAEDLQTKYIDAVKEANKKTEE